MDKIAFLIGFAFVSTTVLAIEALTDWEPYFSRKFSKN